tara:strand:- start:15104 stop:15775 length:672 start_codon:yes stop_codon:yes gene_type:complete
MTVYKSYEAAKISNPGFDVLTKSGKFVSENELEPSPHTYEYRGIAKCNPADHCMTVEKFLAGGYKFTIGDLFLSKLGSVVRVTDRSGSNINIVQSGDSSRYVLRAAALEEEKPRTNIKYERCDFVERWEYFKLMSEEGDLYVNCTDLSYEGFGGDNINLANALHDGSCIYRRIETEITERDEFIEFVESKCSELSVDGEWSFACIAAELFDSGRVKFVSEGDK